jgi:hypothetical protein
MWTTQKVIVQSTQLINRSQRRRGQVEAHHFVQRFGVNSLDENIRLELAFGVFHAKRKVVAGANIFSVVEMAARSIRSMSSLIIYLFLGVE